MIKLFFIAALFLAGKVSAHEMTPTYPNLVPSYVDGLVSAKMTMFNARKDVDYFEIGVFDDEWNPVPFAASAKIQRECLTALLRRLRCLYAIRTRIGLHLYAHCLSYARTAQLERLFRLRFAHARTASCHDKKGCSRALHFFAGVGGQ